MEIRTNVSSYVTPKVLAVDPYVPGAQINEDGWIKLNTNESPFPPSPLVLEAARAEMEKVTLYPNPTSQPLRDAVASFWKIEPAQVICGNGSDDILNLLIRVFSDDSKSAGAMEPSYSLYPILAAINGSRWISVPFTDPFRLPVKEIVAANPNLFFLTCPHAPSGVAFPLSVIEQLAETIDGILVVDEAYGDFASDTTVEILDRHPNLVITRSFSKSFGLAGLRVGYAVASSEIVSLLDRVRDSYNLDRVAQAAGCAALKDWGYFDATIGKITYIRDFYRNEMEGIGWEVYPSQANFLFARPQTAHGDYGPEVAVSLFEFLKSRKILVRYFDSHALTRDFLRISIGDEDQMLTLWETISEWLKKE
ncbi:MAG: histidinol-phosphate transaminase [Verrucomicrobiota bacterium]